MHFHFSFYSSILLIFFSQGIAFSFVLLKKGMLQSSEPSKWLSLFMLLGSIYLLPWMLGFAGWYSLQPYRDILFYVPCQQLLLIGPVIYFYTQSLLNASFKFGKKDFLHLLPALAYLLYSLIIFIADKLILNQYYFYANGKDKDLDTWYQLAGIISMVIYFLVSLRYYNLYKKLIFQTLSYADAVLFNWIKQYLIAFICMQVLRLLFFVLFPGWGDFTGKWWYYVSFGALLYYIGITGYTNNIQSLVPFKMLSPKLPAYASGPGEAEVIPAAAHKTDLANTLTVKQDSPGVDEWKSKIIYVMEAENLYQNQALTLADLAAKLETNQTLISKMINQGFNMNFNDFINNYRIEAVKILLQRKLYQEQTLLGIALECGFNSKTTFNRCFKKNTGFSPTEYIRILEKEADT